MVKRNERNRKKPLIAEEEAYQEDVHVRVGGEIENEEEGVVGYGGEEKVE